MATFGQYLNKIDPNLDVQKKGAIVDPGPYEGIIKNNSDVRRTGRMDIFIPTFGGDETDARSWIPVAYMSPFMGQTNKRLLDKNNKVFFNKSRKLSLIRAINEKFNLAIFDDGLQDKSIKYDLKIVCFNSVSLAGNKLRLPSLSVLKSSESKYFLIS